MRYNGFVSLSLVKTQVIHCQQRIDRIQSTLSSDLDQLFSQTIKYLIDSKGEHRGTDLERNKWIADLTECLRTYDILGLWRDAEDIIRRDAVRGFVKKARPSIFKE